MRKPTIIVIAGLILWSFVLGVGVQAPARGLDLSDILGLGKGGGGGGGLMDVLKIFGIGWVVKHFDSQINTAALAVMKQKNVLPLASTKVVPVVVAGKGGTAIGGVQVIGTPENVVNVVAAAGTAMALNGVNGIGLAPISGKTADAPPTNVVADVSVSMNIRFPK
jgi:hypothetical protein